MRGSNTALSTHPISIGRKVTVVRLGVLGLYIEGRATVVAPETPSHTYRVAFERESRTRVRVVYPAFQRNPEQCIEVFRGLLQADSDDRPMISDFFPDDFGEDADGKRYASNTDTPSDDAYSEAVAGDHGD